MKTEEQIMTSGLPDAVIFVFVAIIFLTVLWSFVRCLEDEEARPGTPQLLAVQHSHALTSRIYKKKKKKTMFFKISDIAHGQSTQRPTCFSRIFENLFTFSADSPTSISTRLVHYRVLYCINFFKCKKKKILKVQRYFDNTGEF